MNSNVFLLLRECNTIKAARGTLQCQSMLLLFKHLPWKCVFCQHLEMGRFCDEVFQLLQLSLKRPCFHTDGEIVSPIAAFCWVNLFTVHDDAEVYSIIVNACHFLGFFCYFILKSRVMCIQWHLFHSEISTCQMQVKFWL